MQGVFKLNRPARSILLNFYLFLFLAYSRCQMLTDYKIHKDKNFQISRKTQILYLANKKVLNLIDSDRNQWILCYSTFNQHEMIPMQCFNECSIQDFAKYKRRFKTASVWVEPSTCPGRTVPSAARASGACAPGNKLYCIFDMAMY